MKKTIFTIAVVLMTGLATAKTVLITTFPENYKKIRSAKQQIDQLIQKRNQADCTVPNNDFDSWLDVVTLVNPSGDTIEFTTPSPWFPMASFISAYMNGASINLEPSAIDGNDAAKIFVDEEKHGADLAVIVSCEGRPVSLSTLLQCKVDINSVMAIEAELTRYDATLDSTIAVGYGYVELYGTFPTMDMDIAIQYFDSTSTADSVYILFSYMNGSAGDEVIFDQVKLNYANTGIEKQQHQESIYIYPNPASHYLNIELEKVGEHTTGIITDITGKVIERMNITESKFSWSVNAFDPGIYFLRIQDEKNVYVKKFIKE